MTVVYKDNLPDFKQQMQRAGKDFIPIVATSSRAAASEFAKAVRRTAPEGKTGRLRRAVVIKRARRVPRGTIHYIVGIRQGKSQQRVRRRSKGKAVTVNLDAFYWYFLERGWVPRRPKDALRGGRRTKALQARRARASGGRVTKHRFILPAFQSSQGRALTAFYSKMDSGATRLNQIK